MNQPKEKTFWDVLNDRQAKGKELVKQGHFPECYMVAYPDDPEVYCTCMDYSPEI